MKIKIIAIIIAILILPGVAIACSLNTVENATECPSSEFATNAEKRLSLKTNDNEILSNRPTDNLEMTVTTDYSLYGWISEPVKIMIAIENHGEEDQTLTFPTSKTCDFIVQNRFGRKIYRWSDDKAFQQAIKYVTIPAGETWSQNLTWKQIGTFLFPLLHYKVLPGTYYITGQIPTINRIYEDTVQIKILFGVVHIFR